ncbi:reverse transcriptase domain-containing protein [Tanacetum coccineum]
MNKPKTKKTNQEPSFVANKNNPNLLTIVIQTKKDSVKRMISLLQSLWNLRNLHFELSFAVLSFILPTVLTRSTLVFRLRCYNNPSPDFDPIVSTSSPTLTPFDESDFLLFEEADAFIAINDEPVSPVFNATYYDPEKSSVEYAASYEPKDENLEVELKELPPHLDDYAIGAVLGQRIEKHFRPIHYASKTMTEAETNYTLTEKKYLQFFLFMLCENLSIISNHEKSVVYTDHSAL